MMLHTENVPVQTGVSSWSKCLVLFHDTSPCSAVKTQPYFFKRYYEVYSKLPLSNAWFPKKKTLDMLQFEKCNEIGVAQNDSWQLFIQSWNLRSVCNESRLLCVFEWNDFQVSDSARVSLSMWRVVVWTSLWFLLFVCPWNDLTPNLLISRW